MAPFFSWLKFLGFMAKSKILIQSKPRSPGSGSQEKQEKQRQGEKPWMDDRGTGREKRGCDCRSCCPGAPGSAWILAGPLSLRNHSLPHKQQAQYMLGMKDLKAPSEASPSVRIHYFSSELIHQDYSSLVRFASIPYLFLLTVLKEAVLRKLMKEDHEFKASLIYLESFSTF